MKRRVNREGEEQQTIASEEQEAPEERRPERGRFQKPQRHG